MHDGRETVRGATGVRNDVVLCGVVLLVVNAHYDREVFVLARRRNDDLFGTSLDVAFRFGRVSKEPGCFDHDLHAKLLPGQGRRALLHREALDLVPVYEEKIVLTVL